jgi:chromosome segregation ATPase
LGAKVTELNETNEQLETQISNLQSKLSDRDRNQPEIDRQTKLLKERIEKLEIDLNKTEHALKERDAIGEKALSAYKKKAQNALAAANARAAAANQAKEEAEMEATTAQTVSDDAFQRARVAEASGKEAMAEAKAYVRDMENEKGLAEKRALEATEALKKSIAEAQHLKNSLDVSRATQEKLVEDVRLISHEREQERAQRWELEHQLAESQRSLDLLYEEVGTLREELRQAAMAAAAAAAASSPAETDKDLWSHARRTSGDTADRSDAEGTIAMLESELRDANRAIKELKDALKTAIVDQGSNGYGHNPASSGFATNHQSAAAPSNGPAGNESMPLFFAMEKQAELSTARDEINRLANLLGDAEFSKMEALEAMEDMKRQMDQAEARLKRFETFGGTNKNPGSAAPVASAPAGRDADGNVNLEYLKNIMLSYLNAKSVAEKKALVPVISAVLCLTPQEQAAVFKNMEQSSSGLESVGMALFESFGSQIRR